MQTGLGTKLRRLLALLDSEVQQVYDSIGIDFRPRFYPIVQLLLEGPQTVCGIAQHVGLSQPAITQTLAEMKKRRLIAAAPGDDRRKQMIRLTPQGRRLVGRLKPVWVATHRAAIALEAELPARLNEVMDQAFLALDRIPFNRRIHNKLRK